VSGLDHHRIAVRPEQRLELAAADEVEFDAVEQPDSGEP